MNDKQRKRLKNFKKVFHFVLPAVLEMLQGYLRNFTSRDCIKLLNSPKKFFDEFDTFTNQKMHVYLLTEEDVERRLRWVKKPKGSITVGPLDLSLVPNEIPGSPYTLVANYSDGGQVYHFLLNSLSEEILEEACNMLLHRHNSTMRNKFLDEQLFLT